MKISDVLSYRMTAANNAWSGASPNHPVNFVFENATGDHQIAIKGEIIEPTWEWFETRGNVYADGEPIYVSDSRNISSYHNVEVTYGACKDDESKIESYLQEKFGDMDFEQVDHAPWFNEDAYHKALEDLAATPPDGTVRLAYIDEGITKGHDDNTYHKITFMQACDRMTFGKDPSIPNPYLVSGYSNGKPTHALYINDTMYNTLRDYTNSDGCEGKFAGVVNAEVKTGKNGKPQPDLSALGRINRPSVPFNQEAHDSFVKSCVKERLSSRPLPKNVPEDVKSSDLEAQIDT